MAQRRRKPGNFRYLLLAFVIASALWGMAHSSSRIERNVDIPVVIYGLPDDIVITEQSSSEINIRVQGSRAALRNVSPTSMEYPLAGEGAKPGPAIYDIEVSNVDRPPGVRIVSRSPARIELKYEARGRKNVRIRADIQGEPETGYLLGDIVVEPERIWLAGARSQVLRLNEAVTEAIDIAGRVETFEKEVRLSMGSGLVWMEEPAAIKVTVTIQAIPTPELDVPPDGGAPRAARVDG
jgi:YbbR domain-containing protein